MLRRGQRVADLGCWPGGWLQVASRIVGASGRVVGVDRTALEPLPEASNVVVLCADIEQANLSERVREALGAAADVLLCDAAPKLSGIRATDRAREEALLLAVETQLEELLRPGGSLILKLLDAPEAEAVVERMRARFERTKLVRVKATRPGSRERYLVAWGLRPV